MHIFHILYASNLKKNFSMMNDAKKTAIKKATKEDFLSRIQQSPVDLYLSSGLSLSTRQYVQILEALK